MQDYNHPIIAVQEYRNVRENIIYRLAKTSHVNLVNLKAAYFDQDTLYLICERINVSLADILGTTRGILAEHKIAIICKEVR